MDFKVKSLIKDDSFVKRIEITCTMNSAKCVNVNNIFVQKVIDVYICLVSSCSYIVKSTILC